MNIVGIHESFNDYPGHISIIMFTKYCTWDCSNCHNKYNLLESDNLTSDYIYNYLEQSKFLTDYVVISGGECTSELNIVPFVKNLFERGFKIKIDTNGTNAEVMKKLLPFIDAVAMDIKEDFISFDKYERICKNLTKKDFENVSKTIKLLSDWHIENPDKVLIFRTTMFDNLIDTEIIKHRLEEYSYSDYIVQNELNKLKKK